MNLEVAKTIYNTPIRLLNPIFLKNTCDLWGFKVEVLGDSNRIYTTTVSIADIKMAKSELDKLNKKVLTMYNEEDNGQVVDNKEHALDKIAIPGGGTLEMEKQQAADTEGVSPVINKPINRRGRKPKSTEGSPEALEQPAKRRGRPPAIKSVTEAPEQPAKRRGRPPAIKSPVSVTGAPEQPAKRRGRPPAIKSPVSVTEAPEQPAKRRGRPPKNPLLVVKTVEQPAKRRGRPPKNSV